MASENFRIVHNAQHEYLSYNKNYIIIETTIKDRNNSIYNDMYEWCVANIDTSWSVAYYDYYSNITFRMWNKEKIKLFKDKFVGFLKTE